MADGLYSTVLMPPVTNVSRASCPRFEGGTPSTQGGAAWDNIKVGAGAPPILVEKGWLLIYHGVKGYGGHLVYRAGVALLDKDKPYKVIARSREWTFQAEAPYEISRLTPNVVFPTGLLLCGDELWMYYGTADTCTCLATAKLDHVLAMLEK